MQVDLHLSKTTTFLIFIFESMVECYKPKDSKDPPPTVDKSADFGLRKQLVQADFCITF